MSAGLQNTHTRIPGGFEGLIYFACAVRNSTLPHVQYNTFILATTPAEVHPLGLYTANTLSKCAVAETVCLTSGLFPPLALTELSLTWELSLVLMGDSTLVVWPSALPIKFTRSLLVRPRAVRTPSPAAGCNIRYEWWISLASREKDGAVRRSARIGANEDDTGGRIAAVAYSSEDDRVLVAAAIWIIGVGVSLRMVLVVGEVVVGVMLVLAVVAVCMKAAAVVAADIVS